MPELSPNKVNMEAFSRLEALENTIHSMPVRAALWLYVDDLERSHEVSQRINTQIGSCWHAIMHRRERDFSNSLYWWRQAGSTTSGLENEFQRIIPRKISYDPATFVGRCERAGNNDEECVQIQRTEWLALFRLSIHS